MQYVHLQNMVNYGNAECIWCESCAAQDLIQNKSDKASMCDYNTIKTHNIFSLQQDSSVQQTATLYYCFSF